ncbi:Glycerophosphoinositol permease 1 [Fusarium oxysporum f. sp. albedinis]|nr:Glycerophosphoinositol permease 1 [Fusarium oxysporum f. sp. albedinis]
MFALSPVRYLWLDLQAMLIARIAREPKNERREKHRTGRLRLRFPLPSNNFREVMHLQGTRQSADGSDYPFR